MKKQHFYILYSEKEENGTSLKLVNSYTNFLCINEEKQFEVVKIYPLKQIRNNFVKILEKIGELERN